MLNTSTAKSLRTLAILIAGLAVAPAIQAQVINEIHADPEATILGDANGDGVRDATEDEFVEIVNDTVGPLDISGWQVLDGASGGTVRHTFPVSTIVPSGGAVVVFGGGTPTGSFGGSIVQTASTGALGFNNGGDDVTLQDAGAVVQSAHTYGSEGGFDQSITRDPDVSGTFVQHSGATGSGGALYSPGTRIDGSTPFPTGAVPPVADFSASTISGPAPLTVDFTDLSTGTIDTWAWDFGDPPATSALQNPQHTYTVAGTYTVELTVSGSAGSDTETKVDFITVTNPAPPTVAQKLMISEIVVTPTAAEFIEIYNPNGFAVDLSDVHITDATFAPGPTFYYNTPLGNGGGGGFGDFNARFPDFSSIGPCSFITVAMSGSDGFFSTYGIDPDYELWEDGGGPDSIPDMVEATTGSIGGQGGLTNSGEVFILYHWDGSTDFVTDLDYAVWGDKAEAVDKTGVTVGTHNYLPDTSIANQDIIALGNHAIDASWQRTSYSEGWEANSGGNGFGDDDETSERLSNSFVEGVPTPGATALLAPRFCVEPETCGPSTWTIDGLTGSGIAYLILAVGESLINGPCLFEATDLDLGGPFVLTAFTVTPSGSRSFPVDLPCAVGTIHLQVFDAGLCQWTNEVVLDL